MTVVASSSALDGPTGGYRNAPTSAPGVNPAGGDSPPSWNLPTDGVLSVDLVELERAVSTFQEAAAAASQSVNDAPLTGDGSVFGIAPWGSDPLGAAFGSQYAEPAQCMRAALEALTILLQETADKLARVGRGFAEADEQASAVVGNSTRFDARD